jgi:hypothetical protein
MRHIATVYKQMSDDRVYMLEHVIKAYIMKMYSS